MTMDEIIAVADVERMRKGYTGKDLAAKAGIAPWTWGSMKLGKTNPSLGIMIDILEALGLELSVRRKDKTYGREPCEHSGCPLVELRKERSGRV